MAQSFTLTGAMVEHLMLLQDDKTLGRALAKLFNTKVRDEPFTCLPEEHKEMGFVVALLADDMRKAERNVNRMRTVRERFGTVLNGSEQPRPLPLKERETSPHTPYIEKETLTPTPTPACAPARKCNSTEILDTLFATFWMAYPRKVAKAEAMKAFVSTLRDSKDPSGEVNTWIKALETQKRSFDWQKDNGKFIPHPATWIRGARWLDVVDAQTETSLDTVKSEVNRKASDMLSSMGF